MSALSLSASEGVDGVSSVAISADFLIEDLLEGEGVEGWVDSSGASTGGGSSQKLWDKSDGHSIVDLGVGRKGLAAGHEVESVVQEFLLSLNGFLNLLVDLGGLSLDSSGLSVLQVEEYLYHL